MYRYGLFQACFIIVCLRVYNGVQVHLISAESAESEVWRGRTSSGKGFISGTWTKTFNSIIAGVAVTVDFTGWIHFSSSECMKTISSLWRSPPVCLWSPSVAFILSVSFCLPAFSAPRFLTAVDQTQRIRVWIGSRNNDEYISHAKSERVCHVYGHCGDGLYQSLSCSARIICYATSQSFGKNNKEW